MLVFDASSMIYAWDNYPVNQFPPFWQWIATQVEQRALVMPKVAFEEVEHKASDCAQWLKELGLVRLEVTNVILQDANRIKGLLGVVDDNYGADGVGENDLLIIATARVHGVELVSDERKQPLLPKKLSNCKIPAVCNMNTVNVPCINFLEYIKSSQVVFGINYICLASQYLYRVSVIPSIILGMEHIFLDAKIIRS